MLKAKSDRIFLLMSGAGLAPLVAIALALTKAAHDLPLILASGPAPIAGLCQRAVSYTLSPFAHASYVLLGGLAIVSCLLGVTSLTFTVANTRRRLTQFLSAQCAMPHELAAIFRECGLAAGVLVKAEEPRAFTYGYLRPRVAITTGLVRQLGNNELRAVLLHEAAHVHRRDPLRMVIVAALSRAFVFAPAVRELARQFQAAKEIDADRHVVATMRTRKHLASALLQADGACPGGGIVGFNEVLDARIASLEGEEPFPPVAHKFLGRTVTTAALGGVALGLFFITTGAVDAHVLHICA